MNLHRNRTIQSSWLPACKIGCNLGIRVHHGPTALVPGGQQNAAVPAFMFNVLQPVDEIRDATEAEAKTDDRRPSTTQWSAIVTLSPYQRGKLTWLCPHCDTPSLSTPSSDSSGNPPAQRPLVNLRVGRRSGIRSGMGAAFAAIVRVADAAAADEEFQVAIAGWGSTRAFAQRLAVGRTWACVAGLEEGKIVVGRGKVGWVRSYRNYMERVSESDSERFPYKIWTRLG